MTKEDALQIVLLALTNLNDEFDDGEKIVVTPLTSMFGSDAAIDSLSLVSVIVDVEQAVGEAEGRPISLTDDRAINEERSPFQTPEALASYIAVRTSEAG